MACKGHEVPRPPKNAKSFRAVLEKTSEHKPVLVGYRKLGHPLSAQDLRCFEMENEKIEDSSPRGVLEAFIRGLDDEPGPPPQTNTSDFEFCNSNLRAPSRWHRFFKLWKTSNLKQLSSFPPFSLTKISRRKSKSARENRIPDLFGAESPWKNFTLSDLQEATNYFSQDNLIGKGGYSEVYKGCLPDGQLIAVKRLNKGTPEDRVIELLSEIGIMAHVNHPNTAKLIGYGVEGGTFLVLQLSSLGSLGSFLNGSKHKLDWGARYKIILGTADGLMYLHENCERRIIHRDVKAENILLTENFEPQICDFGLAKWLPKQWSHHNVSKFEGTFGYFAPEYCMHGIVDEKTDVFSFGVLLLELITGRRALDDTQQSLVIWAKPLLDNNDIKELVDPCLGSNYNPDEIDCVILTASLCIEQTPMLRPRMSQVVILLRAHDHNQEGPKNRKHFLQRTYSQELLDAEEYNSTKYLSDLNRHKLIALGS